ncbi:diguanylate phosphodiesterase [Desulfatibacillum aliphaticivorans]|uniref:Diguanylate phosphodiesterase n=1 Tax=Desulfatibacillum aliphaticivorans TaxID=218208 RepID=B8FLF3_DESAL|nr:EAL domain-containing protein [Desulfatibacillum aliphaticivorans]ACL05099.1 diguanylate phosphodiesterase [Desulfatibacillum aliphaticivorans]
MLKKISDQDKVCVDIHEGFYYNRTLSLPTVIQEYEKVESILIDLQYMACITVQIEQLSKVEYLYGSNSYNYLLLQLTDILKDIKHKEFRGRDIFVVDLYDADTFVIFLSAPRDDRTQLVYHLEAISERIRRGLEKAVFDLLYPYLKEFVRPNIGYALEIQNPMVSNMRLIRQLVRNSKKMGEFIAAKRDYLSRYGLQKIIIEQDIRTVFQAIVDFNTLEVIGYEALSRGPENSEFASPTLMFLMASECGLSFELDRLCRRRALERVRTMCTDKKIFVNTLSMTIHDPEFRGLYLKELLEDLEIKPENVVFEISEKLAIDNYDLFRDAMRDYTDVGIVHAGDDMGTGYSDLERIMELTPGYMKVDISFVKDVHKSYLKQEIVKAMVNLGKSIGSHVIVEGVETKEEYEKLKEIGVPFGQGYLFDVPSRELSPVNLDWC